MAGIKGENTGVFEALWRKIALISDTVTDDVISVFSAGTVPKMPDRQ